MDLPVDDEALEQALAQASARLAARIEQAKAEKSARRRAVIEQWLGRMEPMIAQLAALGDTEGEAEARAQEAALRAELERLGAPAAPRPETAKVAPPDDFGSAITAKVPRLEVPIEPEHETITLPEPPLEDVPVLVKQAIQLLENASIFDPPELEARVSLLTARGRLLQKNHPHMDSNDTRELRNFFGRLTRLCKEHLNPRNVFVPTLRGDYAADWEDERAYWEVELERRIEARQKAELEARARLEQIRRDKQVLEQNQRAFAELVDEIREHLTDDTRDDWWESELRTLTLEALRFAPEGDNELPELLLPHSQVFQYGSDFRNLRKKLRKLGGDSVAESRRLPSVTVNEGTSSIEKPIEQPHERWRGAFTGRRGVMVGGSRREYRRQTLEEFFGFSELEWVENERSETADATSLAQRILNGKYAVVFLLTRFCSHALQEKLKPACKATGTPFALVERGYGAAALGRALEEVGQYVKGPGEAGP